MRRLEREPYQTLYQNAEDAAKSFVYQLQSELGGLVMNWYERKPEKASGSILMLDAEDVKNYDGVYGNMPGLYLHLSGGDVAIYLPKTTLAYNKYLDAIILLHESDDNLYYETIPDVCDCWYDGNETVEIDLQCNIIGLHIPEAYTSSKILAEELVQMLSDLKHFLKVEYFEGDDDGNTDLNADPSNYFVGVRLYYDIKKMR